MLKLLLASLFFYAVHCSCPSGFDLVSDGQCRGLYTTTDVVYYDAVNQAVNLCKNVEGQPIIIHNEEEQNYWRGQGTQSWTTIGLICNSNSKKWVWADGSSVDYKPPVGKYNTNLNNDCVADRTWVIHSDGSWYYYSQTTVWKGAEIFCSTQLQQPVQAADGCQRFNDDSEDGVCYQVGADAASWQDAQLNCRAVGANLASIHNPQENSFVRRLAVSKGAVNGVFLGATFSGKGKDMGWIDGSAWDYENFHPGFPRPGFGECLAMDTTTSAGDWMNIDCASKVPVACIRDPITLIQPNATCGLDTWKEGQIITSPGFPFNASLPCEFWLTAEPGKRVELEIILLEANSCCDNLVIYDGYLGGNVLATLTGEINNKTYTATSSNIMRVLWEPNGGANVRGVAMTFRGV